MGARERRRGSDGRCRSLMGAKRGPVTERFWRFVHPEPNSGCWLWAGSADRKGYGQIMTAVGLVLATHVSLSIDGKCIPSGMMACHRCDNPPCVNPDHLFVGTAKDNTDDAMKKGRLKMPPKVPKGTIKELGSFCRRGHPRTSENTFFVSPRVRHCRLCTRLNRQVRRAAFVAQGLRCDGIPRRESAKPKSWFSADNTGNT